MYNLRGHRLDFSNKKNNFVSFKIIFVLPNRVDPDEMLHYGFLLFATELV